MVFFICGFTVILLLFSHFIFISHHPSAEFQHAWISIAKICLIAIGVVMSVLNITAIVKNIKLTKINMTKKTVSRRALEKRPA